MKHLTKRQAAIIARATKKICLKDGNGNTVQVYSDYDWAECPSTARLGVGIRDRRGMATGGIKWPIAVFLFPQTIAQITDQRSWPR